MYYMYVFLANNRPPQVFVKYFHFVMKSIYCSESDFILVFFFSAVFVFINPTSAKHNILRKWLAI